MILHCLSNLFLFKLVILETSHQIFTGPIFHKNVGNPVSGMPVHERTLGLICRNFILGFAPGKGDMENADSTPWNCPYKVTFV